MDFCLISYAIDGGVRTKPVKYLFLLLLLLFILKA